MCQNRLANIIPPKNYIIDATDRCGHLSSHTNTHTHPEILSHFYNLMKVKVKLCPTLCDLIDCSLPGSSIRVIFQARVLEWVAISFSRGYTWPRDWTRVSCIVGRRFTVWATREALNHSSFQFSHSVCPTLCNPMNRSTPGIRPSSSPRVHSNSHLLSQQCHPAI